LPPGYRHCAYIAKPFTSDAILALLDEPRENLVKSTVAIGTSHIFPAFALEAQGGPMGRSARYRRYAAECLEMASVIHDPKARATLWLMAQVWLRLAGQGDLHNAEEKSDQGDARQGGA